MSELNSTVFQNYSLVYTRLYSQRHGPYSGKKVCKLLNISNNTLQNLTETRKIQYDTFGDINRYYLYSKKHKLLETICYCHVSTSERIDNLNRQKNELSMRYPYADIVEDIGSGISYKRKNLIKILERAISGNAEIELVITRSKVIHSGFDIVKHIIESSGGKLTILDQSDITDEEKLKLEKDVEEKLLEPLLIRLGYTISDWVRQLKIPIGSKDRIIPDYIILPDYENGHQICHWVWEAKYSIKSEKQFIKAFNQAYSYAKILNSEGLGLVSQEGIYLSKSPYSMNEVINLYWEELKNINNFNKVFEIAGKR